MCVGHIELAYMIWLSKSVQADDLIRVCVMFGCQSAFVRCNIKAGYSSERNAGNAGAHRGAG